MFTLELYSLDLHVSTKSFHKRRGLINKISLILTITKKDPQMQIAWGSLLNLVNIRVCFERSRLFLFSVLQLEQRDAHAQL